MSYRFTPPEGRDSRTLHQVLARRVACHGQAPWIAGEARSWTYRDINAMSDRIANGLAARGIGAGETVLVMLPDCVEFIATWCGLAKLGAVQVPVNTHLRGNVLSHVVGDSRARTMIVHAQYLERIAAIEPGHVQSLIVLGEMPDVGPDAGSDAGPDTAPDVGPDAESGPGPDAESDTAPNAGLDAESGVGPDAESDTAPDARPDAESGPGPDAESDTAPDAGLDAESGVGPDAESDTAPDARPDAESDAGPDTAPDAGPDAESGAGPNVGPDTAPDAGPSAGPNVGPDTAPDAGPNVGPDAESDTAPDVGPDTLVRRERSAFEALLDAPGTPVSGGPAATDLVAVLYTSGTTGPSKGVMITHIQAYEYARSVVELLELGPDDVYYAPLPLFHIAGQWGVTYAACLAGARAVLPRPFSAGAYWADVRRHRATSTFLLGAMANFLFQQPEAEDDADNPLERALVVPLLPGIEAFKRRFGCLVSTTWGATEFNVPTRSTFELANSRTCGRVAEDRYEVRIVDDLDRELPPGVPGEAVVRPREPWITMAGYWGHPEWTAAAWRNLWLHTGDMLMRDEAGNLYFVDRTSDAIRRRGENISSMEVEREIVAHPDVVECAVIPVASEHTEQEVMAVVVPRPGTALDPVALVEFLAPRMAYFMVPRYVEVADALPMTQTGKVRKYTLRERGLTPQTWDREAAGIRLRR